MASYDWIIGVGVSFLIAILLTVFASIKKDGSFEPNGKIFLMFLPIGFGIMVYSGLIDFWYFVLAFIFSIALLFYEFTNRSSV